MASITVGIVVYKAPSAELEPLLDTITKSVSIRAWVVIDNAATEDPAASNTLCNIVEQKGGRYLAPTSNIGFGAGHNLALRSLIDVPSDFHLMVNPDISLTEDALNRIADRMHSDTTIGLILPRVVYPDGREQFLAKLLPTPMDFALRRFAPAFIQDLARQRMDRYELRASVHRESKAIPFLSGCFMFARRSAIETIGGFDERFFLYLEDVDLCRRLASISTLLYLPSVTVVHGYHRGAHHNRKLMLTFLRSSMLYFAKWGWFFDKGRRVANRRALAEIAAPQKDED